MQYLVKGQNSICLIHTTKSLEPSFMCKYHIGYSHNSVEWTFVTKIYDKILSVYGSMNKENWNRTITSFNTSCKSIIFTIYIDFYIEFIRLNKNKIYMLNTGIW